MARRPAAWSAFLLRWGRLSPNARATVLVLVGSAIFALNDTVVKVLGLSMNPVQMGLFRYVFGFLFLLPTFLRHSIDSYATRCLHIHLGRSVIAGIGQVGLFYAVVHMHLADVTAIAFSRPLFLTVLAVVFLGEVVSGRRWTATAVGFVGVLIMVRPGSHGLDWTALIAVGSSCLFAIGLMLVRYMARTEPAHRILFYYHVGSAAALAGPALWFWTDPTAAEWGMLFLVSAFTTLGMVCFVRGFMMGEASIVGPMEYVRLVYAALLGYFLFAEVPDIWTGVGALVIVAATIYIARREALEARRKGIRYRPSVG